MTIQRLDEKNITLQLSADAIRQGTKLFNRNFFLLWQGQSISQIGSQLFDIILVLWVKELTGSATLAGLMLATSGVILVTLGPIGGTIVDRFSRKWIIVLTDFVNGIAMLSLAALLFLRSDATDLIVIALFAVLIINAAASSLFGPAINSSVPDLVPKNKIDNANSVLQITYSLAVFVGQGIGGTLFRIIGAPFIILFNGISFLFSSFSELFISLPKKQAVESEKTFGEQINEFRSEMIDGFTYIWQKAGLRELLLISMVTAFFTAPGLILLPFFVEDFLNVSSDWYGFMLAGYSVGNVLGFVTAGGLPMPKKNQALIIIVFFLMEAIGYGGLGLAQNPISALILFGASGFASGVTDIKVTTIVQTTTPTKIRGRVFGLLGTLVGAITTVAFGLSGIIADLTGQNIPLIYMVSGLISALFIGLISFSKPFQQLLSNTDLPIEEEDDDESETEMNQSEEIERLSDEENETEIDGNEMAEAVSLGTNLTAPDIEIQSEQEESNQVVSEERTEQEPIVQTDQTLADDTDQNVSDSVDEGHSTEEE